MGKDVSDVIGTVIGNAAREAIQNVSENARKQSRRHKVGPGKLAAGAAGLGLAAAAPLATRAVSKLASGAVEKGAEHVKGAGQEVGDTLQEKVQGGMRNAIPGSDLFSKSDKSKSGKSESVPGVGKGRRMPVQQDLDIGVPVSHAYNQWTQFEDWPNFMHRLTQVSQEDDTHVKFKTKIWGVSKEFTAEIIEQRPDERIKWRVTEGVTHTGVVTFHEIGPRLTRVELNLDVEPGSLIEKAARGMRHVKRAVRADMARFKGYVLMQEDESGAWRGKIEDGDVKTSASGRGRSASRSSQSGSSRRARGATNGKSDSSRTSKRSNASRRRSGSHS